MIGAGLRDVFGVVDDGSPAEAAAIERAPGVIRQRAGFASHAGAFGPQAAAEPVGAEVGGVELSPVPQGKVAAIVESDVGRGRVVGGQRNRQQGREARYADTLPPEQQQDEAAGEDAERYGRAARKKRDGAGQRARPRGDPDHLFEAPAHHCQGGTVEPERHQEKGREGRGHGDEAEQRHGGEVADQPIPRPSPEMQDRVARRGRPGDQAGGGEATKGTRDPARGRPRQELSPRIPPAIGDDQRRDRREAHVEARREDRLGMNGEGHERRDADAAQAEGLTLDDDGREPDRNHDVGALCGDACPAEQEVGGRHYQRDRRSRLAHVAQARRRQQRQQEARQREGVARADRHVEAADGDDMGEARIPHRRDLVGRDVLADTGHQRGLKASRLGRGPRGNVLGKPITCAHELPPEALGKA